MMKKRVLGLVFPFRSKSTDKKTQVQLIESSVAGFRYYRGEEILRKLEPGRPLDLKREPRNPFDYDAVEIYHENEKLGYIPRSESAVIAQLMDKGVTLTARISGIRDSGTPNERVGVAVGMIT